MALIQAIFLHEKETIQLFGNEWNFRMQSEACELRELENWNWLAASLFLSPLKAWTHQSRHENVSQRNLISEIGMWWLLSLLWMNGDSLRCFTNEEILSFKELVHVNGMYQANIIWMLGKDILILWLFSIWFTFEAIWK